VIAIAAFAAVSAYADLYRLRKAEKVLSTRLANESAAQFGEARSADAVLDATGPGSVGAISPLPKLSAYDILLEISAKVPRRTRSRSTSIRSRSTTRGRHPGHDQDAEGIDLLVAELRKVECFRKSAAVRPTRTPTVRRVQADDHRTMHVIEEIS